MREIEFRPFVSNEEAASIYGVAPDTIKVLVELKAGIHSANRRGFRKIDIYEVRWLLRDYPNPNDALPEGVIRPLFALHDDGRWWPLLGQDEARATRKDRFFTGVACEAGHVVKRYTKTGKCVDCCQAANGKPTSKENREAKNSSALPG